MEPYLENNRILYIDDEPELLNAFSSLMRKENLEIKTLQDSNKINELLDSEKPYAVVLSDQRMPGTDGVQVLEAVRLKSRETHRVLITGYADHKDTIRAINVGGINSYISKPWDDENLKQQVKDWVSQYNLKQQNQYLLKLIEEENQKLNEVLEGTVAQTIRILGDLANHVSPQVAELQNGVKSLGSAFLKILPNISATERWDIMRAFDLFNLGILLLPPSVQATISAKGLLVIDSSPVIRNHHLLAAGLIKEIPRMYGVAKIIELMYKNFDGTGEPEKDNTSGNSIPYGARLMHILIDLVRPTSTRLRGSEHLKSMEQWPNKYDVQIVKQIIGNNIETNQVAEEILLEVNNLQPGMMLVDDVYSGNKQPVFKAKTTLTETYLNILRQWHKRDPLIEPIKVKYKS